MQVFAAMVHNLDSAIAELLSYLASKQLADNTLVVFASDNGADGTARGAGLRDTHDNSTEQLGTAASYVTQGIDWAQVSSTPYRLVKAFPTEGGTRAPLIVRWPGQVDEGRDSPTWLRIDDLAPAFLQVAGLRSARGARAIAALTRGSPMHASGEVRIHTYVERRLGGASVVRGDYKLVWWKDGGEYRSPMLFNLANDPTETRDIADEEPEIVNELVEAWREYASLASDGISEANPIIGR